MTTLIKLHKTKKDSSGSISMEKIYLNPANIFFIKLGPYDGHGNNPTEIVTTGNNNILVTENMEEIKKRISDMNNEHLNIARDVVSLLKEIDKMDVEET